MIKIIDSKALDIILPPLTYEQKLQIDVCHRSREIEASMNLLFIYAVIVFFAYVIIKVMC